MDIEIEGDNCLRVGDKVKCKKQYKKMIDSTIRALELDYNEYRAEKEDLRKIVDKSLEDIGALFKTKRKALPLKLDVSDFTKHLQQKELIPRNTNLTRTARVRLKNLGYELTEKPKTKLMSPEMFEYVKEQE